MQTIKFSVLFVILFSLVSTSCKKKKKEDEDTVFQKSEIMTQLANNWIIPIQLELQTNVNELETSWNTYTNSNLESDLILVKENWKKAYLTFQKIKMIDVGPANSTGLMLSLGTFPTDTTQINANISNGNYDLNSGINYASIGFPALDYLFYRTNTFNQLATTATKNYVGACINKMKTEIDQLVVSWETYKTEFIAGTGTSSTDDFAMLVNAFCKDFEQLKTAKVGIPLGKQSLGILRPEYLEARYSGISSELIIENLKGLKAVFLGNYVNEQSGIGFDNYLQALEKTTLSNTIQNRFDDMILKTQNWSGKLEDLMQTNYSQVDEFYVYISQSVVYLKTDMASAFGILITYQDNDGD